MLRKFSILSFLLLAVASVSAQTSTQGTEFWLSFMMNGYRYNDGAEWVSNGVMVSAKRNCSGVITNPVTGWSESFSVEAARVTFVSVPLEEGYNDLDETVASRGLKVVTTDTVSLYYYSCATNSFDGTFVMPIESVGSEYIIQTDAQSDLVVHEEIRDQYTSAFLVVATEDNTKVDITPTVRTISGHEAGQVISLTLDAGQTYSIRSHYGEGSRD